MRGPDGQIKDESVVRTPEEEYDPHGGWQPRKIKISLEVKKTIDILESDTIYTTALVANINAFHRAIQTEKDLGDTRVQLKNQADKIETLERRLAALEEKEKKSAAGES